MQRFTHITEFEFIRLAANGRIEVRCPYGHYYWLTVKDLAKWQYCPHCLGWWIWS